MLAVNIHTLSFPEIYARLEATLAIHRRAWLFATATIQNPTKVFEVGAVPRCLSKKRMVLSNANFSAAANVMNWFMLMRIARAVVLSLLSASGGSRNEVDGY